MPRLPIYQQQSVAQPTMSTPNTFGAGSAQALAQQGDVLAQIGDRIQRRNEVIDRVRQMNAFEQSVNEDSLTVSLFPRSNDHKYATGA